MLFTRGVCLGACGVGNRVQDQSLGLRVLLVSRLESQELTGLSGFGLSDRGSGFKAQGQLYFFSGTMLFRSPHPLNPKSNILSSAFFSGAFGFHLAGALTLLLKRPSFCDRGGSGGRL